MAYEEDYQIRFNQTKMVEEYLDSVLEYLGSASLNFFDCYESAETTFLGASGSWRTMEDDMKTLSRKYPGVLMEVYDQSEYVTQPVKHYFRDGKHAQYKSKIVFEPFSNRDLK